MAVVFTIATTATYVALCVTSSAAAERAHLGPLEYEPGISRRCLDHGDQAALGRFPS